MRAKQGILFPFSSYSQFLFPKLVRHGHVDMFTFDYHEIKMYIMIHLSGTPAKLRVRGRIKHTPIGINLPGRLELD